MVDVMSSDVPLLFRAPGTLFDEGRTVNKSDPGNATTPGRRDKISGTKEVAVGKSVWGGLGKGRRTEVLLKAKVVLEKDVTGS